MKELLRFVKKSLFRHSLSFSMIYYERLMQIFFEWENGLEVETYF